MKSLLVHFAELKKLDFPAGDLAKKRVDFLTQDSRVLRIVITRNKERKKFVSTSET